MEKRRRLPCVERSISGISAGDFRVRVLGTVVDRDEVSSSVILDDSTGKAAAFFSNEKDFALAEEGRLVRVMGKIRKDENIEIDVEIIQDMTKLDLGLYEQVKYVSERLR